MSIAHAEQSSGKQETWQRILAAARTVFARDGYVEATLSEVAREAAVGKSTLYRHVECKADLFVEMLSSRGEDRSARIEAILSSEDSAEDQLRALAAEFFQFLDSRADYRPMLWAIDSQELIGDISARLIERAFAIWEPQIEAVKRIVERGVARGEFRSSDPHLTAHVLWNWSVLALDLQYSPVRRQMLQRPLGRFFEESLELAIRGLRADSPAEILAVDRAAR